MDQTGKHLNRALGLLVGASLVVGLSRPARAQLDPNCSDEWPTGGYGIIICGNSIVFGNDYDEIIKGMLRDAYRRLTEVLLIEPNNVWVLVDRGEDDWTEGLFDALPANKTNVSAAFRTIGQRMWDDANTPRNLVAIIAGHGSRYSGDPATKTLLQLASGLIYDYRFVNDCFNQINNNAYNGSPIERLDLIMTPCYGGGLIDDFRTNFHNRRGSSWPYAKHFSSLTAGDCYDITTGIFGAVMLNAVGADPNVFYVPDINGDGVLSIYEYFRYAARQDITNPQVSYTPYVPETIYVRGQNYVPLGYSEHPLYYEWNAPVSLQVTCRLSTQGHVEIRPEPNDPNAWQYPLGTRLTLTAVPAPDRFFKYWELYDPNYPGDDNYVTIDANNPLTLFLRGDRQITAVFGCSSGMGQVLPLMAVGMGLIGLVSRLMLKRRQV